MATIDQSISFLQTFARDALGRAATVSNRIATGGGVVLGGGNFSHTVKQLDMARPPQLSDMLGDATDTSQETLRFLDVEAEKWVDKYFPEMNACLKTTPEEWLCGIITGEKPLGLSQAAFEAVWHEGRDRAYRAQRSESQQLRAEFSRRGFAVPPGAMLSAVAESEVRASDAIAAVNREQTNRDAEIKLDLLKFAEEQAIKLKLGVMGALAEFYRQWVALPDKDLERQRVKAQVYASFQSALSAYYNVELGFERLRLAAAEAKSGSLTDADRNRVTAIAGLNSSDALGNASRGFADAAAAAANAQSAFSANILTGRAPS